VADLCKPNSIVLRAGVVTETQIRNGAHVDHEDIVSDLSVQVWDSNTEKFTDWKTIAKLRAPVPNPSYALARAHDFTDLGGTIKWDRLPNNQYHALLSGLTVDQIVKIFSRNQY
jgi:hypothetical protein